MPPFDALINSAGLPDAISALEKLIRRPSRHTIQTPNMKQGANAPRASTSTQPEERPGAKAAPIDIKRPSTHGRRSILGPQLRRNTDLPTPESPETQAIPGSSASSMQSKQSMKSEAGVHHHASFSRDELHSQVHAQLRKPHDHDSAKHYEGTSAIHGSFTHRDVPMSLTEHELASRLHIDNQHSNQLVPRSLPLNIPSKVPNFSLVRENNQIQYKVTDFKLMRKIGTGGCAAVYQVKRLEDGKLFALKAMRRDVLAQREQEKHVRNEKLILEMTFGSRFITQMLASFKDPVHIYMVQEYLIGGDMFHYLKKHGRFDEASARFYAAQVMLGISYLHSNKIIHRDIKPENILLDVDGNAKLADLGYARVMTDRYTTTFCGTPSYMAPEILKQRPYSYPVDWWAFGVVLFQLNTASSPFQERHANDTFTRILSGNIRWPANESLLTPKARNLIEGLFVSANKRLTEDKIRQHEYFADTPFEQMDMGVVPAPQQVIVNVRNNLNMIDKQEQLELSGPGRQVPDAFLDF